MQTNGMAICVAGWYFDPQLFEVFRKLDFDITVVSYYNRVEGGDPRKEEEIPVPVLIEECFRDTHVKLVKNPNGGLEFGNYDWYIKNIWDRKSAVLFMHDDIRIHNIEVFKTIQNRLKDHDQAFIFRDEVEEIANGRQHGRGIYCSARFIKYMLDYVCECPHSVDHQHPHYPNEKVILRGVGPHTGFFYDPYNLAEHTSGQVPKYCRHYNEAVYHFSAFAGRCTRTDGDWPGFKSKVAVYFPDFNSGKRGTWQGVVYGRENIPDFVMAKTATK